MKRNNSLQSCLFICLEDSNILLHLSNLPNISLWAKAIENMLYWFKKSTPEKPLCCEFLLRIGHYLADCNLMQIAIYCTWKPVRETINPHSYLLKCMHKAVRHTAWWVLSISNLSYALPHPSLFPKDGLQCELITNSWKIRSGILRNKETQNSYLGNK